MEEDELPTLDPISPDARERFERPRHYGALSDFQGHARLTGPCGDTMEFWVNAGGDRVCEVGFVTDGCGPSRAAGSMAAELAAELPLHTAAGIGQKDILEALGGLPSVSEHCALLASNTLKAALRDLADRPPPSRDSEPSGDPACSPSQSRPHGASEKACDGTQELDEKMDRIRYKLVVMSGKGGVGKSSLAVNLATELSLAGHDVGLLDVDIHGPSIPRLTGLEGQRLVTEGQELVPLEIGGNLKVMSIGFLLAANTDAVIWRGPMKHSVIEQFLSRVAWGPLDYLVIDAPPGTGDEPLSVAQLVGQPAGALLVTTPQDLSVNDVRRSVAFCQKVELPVVGIVENMSGLVCPHCTRPIELFKSGGGAALAEEMGVPLLGCVPLDPQIVQCSDGGLPYIHRFADHPAAKALKAVAQQIAARSLDQHSSN